MIDNTILFILAVIVIVTVAALLYRHIPDGTDDDPDGKEFEN